MHELGVVFHVIKMVEEVVDENKLKEVSAVTLELGEVSTVVPSYLHDVWKWAVDNRSEHMKGAELKIETLAAITYCDDCQKKYRTVPQGKICPYCGSENTFLIQGNEFKIKEIEGC